MFNSNFSIAFISKMVALNSAASFPEAGLIFRQQSIFPCAFPSGGSDFFWSWFIPVFVFPLCHTSSLALFGFYYIGIYSPYERIHPPRRAQSIFQRCMDLEPFLFPHQCPSSMCCWKGSRQDDILSQGLIQIFEASSQDRYHRILLLILASFPLVLSSS